MSYVYYCKFWKNCKLRKTFLSIAVLICILFSSTVDANAAGHYVFGHYMIGGIGDIYMYIDGKNTYPATYWQNLIKTAVDNWMYTGVGANNFYCLGYVNSGTSGSKIDWYAHGYSYWGNPEGVLADTLFYPYQYSQGRVYPWESDWYSAEIQLNDWLLRSDEVSNDDAIWVFVHEMGHAFGLAHNVDRNSVMYESLDLCNVRRVQRVDNDALNSLY